MGSANERRRYNVTSLIGWTHTWNVTHYDDVIMGAIASLITSLTIVYSTVYSDADLSKHQSSASLAFVWGIHRGPVNSPHKWPVMWKMFPFDDVIMRVSLAEPIPSMIPSAKKTHWMSMCPHNNKILKHWIYIWQCLMEDHVYGGCLTSSFEREMHALYGFYIVTIYFEVATHFKLLIQSIGYDYTAYMDYMLLHCNYKWSLIFS